MSKQIVAVVQTEISHVKKLFCGIDVGAETLAVAVMDWDHPCIEREFANTVTGHKALLGWLGKMRAQVRVSLEATGIYSMDLALALDATEYVEIAVLNPKRVHDFARTLRRSKTDSADAQVLAEFSLRMPFAAWQKPSRGALAVRAVSRHLEALVVQQRREANRLHAAERSIATPRCVIADLKRSLAGVGRRIVKLRREAMTLIAADANLKERFHLLTGVPGIAAVSALQILGELVLLAPDMKVRQWVARSGLDPVHQDSGTSVHKPSRISRAGSRHLRRALYMPALAAVRWDPHMKAFYEALLARHKRKLQALIAVARKLLHAIYGIFRTRTPYDGRKLFPHLETA